MRKIAPPSIKYHWNTAQQGVSTQHKHIHGAAGPRRLAEAPCQRPAGRLDAGAASARPTRSYTHIFSKKRFLLLRILLFLLGFPFQTLNEQRRLGSAGGQTSGVAASVVSRTRRPGNNICHVLVGCLLWTHTGAFTGATKLSVVLKTSRSTSSSTSAPLHVPGMVTMETPMRYPETSECRVMASLKWDSTIEH